MTVAAYKVWKEVKAWEEEQAEKRRAEEEGQDSEEGEEEVLMLKVRRPKGGLKVEGETEGEKGTEAEVKKVDQVGVTKATEGRSETA